MKARRQRPSLAQRLRDHRVAFQLAQELGCTPREAEAELARRESRRRWLQAKARLDAKLAGRPLPRTAAAPLTEEERPTAWWKRD